MSLSRGTLFIRVEQLRVQICHRKLYRITTTLNSLLTTFKNSNGEMWGNGKTTTSRLSIIDNVSFLKKQEME